MHILIEVWNYSFQLPVVIRAERITAGDHVGWKDLMYPAAPETCGQDIDVPDTILNSNVLFSPKISEIGECRGQLAIISTPGAVKSGCNIKQKNVNNKLTC